VALACSSRAAHLAAPCGRGGGCRIRLPQRALRTAVSRNPRSRHANSRGSAGAARADQLGSPWRTLLQHRSRRLVLSAPAQCCSVLRAPATRGHGRADGGTLRGAWAGAGGQAVDRAARQAAHPRAARMARQRIPCTVR
jgi:hypothetical protein